jgi:NAD-dependent SIR2 family protein deacetylase
MSKYSVKDLAQFIKKSKESGTPFVLFTGAGCSKSAGIPLAGELVEKINEDFELELKGLSKDDRQNYGKCMSVLVKEDRRKLISDYISKAKINWTHIAIALLIEKGYFQRVLTFNFDNLLARSSGLLGLYPATYDLTTADLDLHNLIVEPAVVHIHGQSHGFTLLNSDEETSKHAESLENFIASTLNQSPTLFVGYSGYADAFFPILEKKYTGQHRLFWSGRSKKEPEHLSTSLLKNYGSFTHYIQGEDSDIFFIELAQELGCFPPKIFENPYDHLLDELKHVTDFPLHESIHRDLFAKIKKQLKNDSEQYLKESLLDTDKLLIEGRYQELIDLYDNNSKLLETDLDNIALAYLRQCNDLIRNTNDFELEEIKATVIENYSKALEVKKDFYLAPFNLGVFYKDLASFTSEKGVKKIYVEREIEQYRKSILINANDYFTYNNLCSALLVLSDFTEDVEIKETLILEALGASEQAIKIDDKEWNAYCLFGQAYFTLGEIKTVSNDKEKYFKLALNYFDSSNMAKPNNEFILDTSGLICLKLYTLTAKKYFLDKSFEYLNELDRLNPKKVYNLACAYALNLQLDKCRAMLERALASDTLPSKMHLLKDKDLDVVCELEWFKELISKAN